MVKLNLKAEQPKPWLDGNQVDALFRQETYWIDAERSTHQIREMSDRHLVFTHRYVRRHYYRWRDGALLNWLLEPIEMGVFASQNPEWDERPPLPEDVRGTPLFKALDVEMDKRELEKLET